MAEVIQFSRVKTQPTVDVEKLEEAGIDPYDEKTYVSMVNNLYQESRDLKLPLEKEWYTNIAFDLGFQWTVWDGVQQRLRTRTPPKRDTVRLTINRIHPAVRILISKATKTKPKWTVVPHSNETTDIEAARVGDKALGWAWQEFYLADKLEELITWAVVCGDGFWKIVWNPNGGRYLGTRQGPKGLEPRYEGQIEVQVPSPFSIFPDVGAVNIRGSGQAEEIVESHIMPVERARALWPDKAHQIRPMEITYDRDLGYQTRLLYDFTSSVASGTASSRRPDTSISRRAVIYEYYQRPNRKHPKGLYIVVNENRLLYVGPNPTPEGELPYIHVRSRRVSGRLWGQGIVSQARSPQVELNKKRSQICEQINATIKGKCLAPKGSGISVNAFVDDVTVMEYNPVPGYEPHWAQMPAIAPQVFDHINRLEQDINELFGIHEVSKAGTPSGVKSGRAIAYLQEQDDTQLGLFIRGVERFIQQAGRLTLAQMGKYWKVRRTLTLVGDDMVNDVFSFHGADLAGHYDVVVQAGSALPENKALKQDFIMNAMQIPGLLSPQKAAQMLEFGDPREIFESEAQDRNNAKMENRAMLAGDGPPQANIYDNDAVHREEHFKEMKKFTNNPPMADVEAAFRDHWEMHKIQITEKAQEMQLLMQAMQAPPEAGPAGTQAPPEMGAQGGRPITTPRQSPGVATPQGGMAETVQALRGREEEG